MTATAPPLVPSVAPANNSAASPTEHTFTLGDGTALFYRAWLPATPFRRVVFLFHRGHEHSGRFIDMVEALGLTDTAVFAWDARGHGRSPGERGYASSFSRIVRDIDEFVRGVSKLHGLALNDCVVLAHSVGAVAVAAWVHDYAPPIRAMILCTPALRVKLYIPLAVPGLRLLQRLRGEQKCFIKSYVRAKMLTHDAEQARRYNADPLIARSIAVNILLDLHDLSTRLMNDAGAITVPTLVLSAGKDWVVHLTTQRRLFEQLSSPIKRMRVFPGMYHDILHEKDRQEVLDEARRFIVEAFEASPSKASLLNADTDGYTKREYETLRRPLPVWSPRRWSFAFQRLSMKTLGRLSDGVRLGWDTGFDSGKTLDYVYENRPRGVTPIGRAIDKTYLNSVGSRGIRQRKVHLETMLRTAIERTHAEGRPVRILDVATGIGRYVLDVMRSTPGVPMTALLRDWTEANLDAGRNLAAELGVAGVTFERGDAFDGAALAAITPTPTIAIVSGLYELFSDNQKVLGSLKGLASAMRGGGWLIYTGQPWHPQVEMIARVLINRDGEPWIMRRRTQAEMDELVRIAGFEKVDMLIDGDGIFTVSLAHIGTGP